MTRRPMTDAYFMRIATVVATRATCPRKHVGAVLVQDGQIISTGYNGAAAGLPHCTDTGCHLENDHCTVAVHAEVNSVIQAAKHGTCVNGATLYVTVFPCWHCTKLLINAGVKRVVYGGDYRNEERVQEAFADAGVELRQALPEIPEVVT